MNKFIFDVDGTITPSRGKIDEEFATWFKTFCSTHPVYLVTGSDKPKTVEQVGTDIYNLSSRVYNCSGSEVWRGEVNIRSTTWNLPISVRRWLTSRLDESTFPLRTGAHIEERVGMVNFSIVGRGATLGERKLYVKHDTAHDERNQIAKAFNAQFEDLIARPGGETGIDISPKGADKSQITQDFDPTDILYFYGDRMDPMGNDYPLKRAIIDKDLGFAIEVLDWKDTWNKLKTTLENIE
jgi:phosphomannomutase